MALFGASWKPARCKKESIIIKLKTIKKKKENYLATAVNSGSRWDNKQRLQEPHEGAGPVGSPSLEGDRDTRVPKLFWLVLFSHCFNAFRSSCWCQIKCARCSIIGQRGKMNCRVAIHLLTKAINRHEGFANKLSTLQAAGKKYK